MRRPLIAANWKMNLTVEDGEKFITALFTEDIDYNIVDVVIAPSFTSLYPLSNLVMKGQCADCYCGAEYVCGAGWGIHWRSFHIYDQRRRGDTSNIRAL